MSRKFLPLISILLIAAVLLAACAKPTATPTVEPTTPPVVETTEAPTAEPTLQGTITLWHGWKANEINSLNSVVKAFQALYPDVTFDVLYVPFDDLKGKYETAVGAGGGPTVLIGAADWGPALFDATLVEDLKPLVAQEVVDTIVPAALSAVQYKDALVGLPQTLKGVVLFRNKAIIAEPVATFEELVTAAKAATAGDIVGADLEYGFFFSAGHLFGVGGTLMEANGDPTFNNEKGVEWVNFIKSFKDAGPVENYNDNDVNLFKAGKAGYIIDGSWNAADLAKAIGAENLVVDAWPTPMSGFVQTENIYLSANATGDDQAAAVKFIEFFMSAEAQTMLAEVGTDIPMAGHIPAITGLEVTDPIEKGAVAAFATGAPFPVIPEMGAYWDPLNNALKKVMDEDADPAAVLLEAYDAIVAKIAEIRK